MRKNYVRERSGLRKTADDSPADNDPKDSYEDLFQSTNQYLQEIEKKLDDVERSEISGLSSRLPPIRQLYLDSKSVHLFKSDTTGFGEIVNLLMTVYATCVNAAVVRADAACRLAVLHSESDLSSVSHAIELRAACLRCEKALETIALLEAKRSVFEQEFHNLIEDSGSKERADTKPFKSLCEQFGHAIISDIETQESELSHQLEIFGENQQLQSPQTVLDDIEKSFAVCIERLKRVQGLTSASKFPKANLSDLPLHLSQPTFIEAREAGTAISDGRDLRNWRAMEGVIAMLHCPDNAKLQTRFEPSTLLLNWWGTSQGTDLQTLQNELQCLDLEALVTFFVCLSWAVEEYQVTTTLDAIIIAIGRGEDARRSAKDRKEWRTKVWRWLTIFDSLAVVGARPGTWREPRDGDKKREKIEISDLESHDALLKVMGYRKGGQGTFDDSAPPKEVTLAAGPWINQWRGNREILSELGNVRAIADIPRGKPSGSWATCAGLMLQQRWREQAARTPIVKVKSKTTGKEVSTQEFGPFTRRALLMDTWRTDHNVQKVLSSNNPHRAKEYWADAIAILQERAIVGYYKEIKPIKARYGWAEEWLDQPLDIRPVGETRKDALTISLAASKAKKRSGKTRKSPSSPT